MYMGLGQPPSVWQVAYTAETWASSSSSAKWRQGIWCNYYHFNNWTTTKLIHMTVQLMKLDIQKAWGRGRDYRKHSLFRFPPEFHPKRKEEWHQVRKCMLSKDKKLDRSNPPTLATTQWAPALLAHPPPASWAGSGHLPVHIHLQNKYMQGKKKNIWNKKGHHDWRHLLAEIVYNIRHMKE